MTPVPDLEPRHLTCPLLSVLICSGVKLLAMDLAPVLSFVGREDKTIIPSGNNANARRFLGGNRGQIKYHGSQDARSALLFPCDGESSQLERKLIME